MWRAVRAWWSIPGARVRLLALALVALAAYAYLDALSVAFVAVWVQADPDGMEIPQPDQPLHRSQIKADAAKYRAEYRRTRQLAEALALLALALAIAAEWRARHNARTWLWRSSLGLALLAWSYLLDDDWRPWRFWLTGLALVLAALDLRLRRPGLPRAFAWLTLALAISFACARGASALGSKKALVQRVG